MDTAYSSMHQDTPSSFWQTPQYQETPCTPSLTNSRPGTPYQCDTLQTPSSASSSQQSIPITSQLQAVSDKPSIIQGAVQNFWMQSGLKNGCLPNIQRTPGSNSHSHIRRGHRGRALGSKYQNAYNRRPEHHYIHRPVYRGFHNHNRFGSSSNHVPFGKFQEHSNSDKLKSLTQYTPDKSKPDVCLNQNFTSSARNRSVSHNSVFEDPPPLPQKTTGLDIRNIHPDHANAPENNLNEIPREVDHNRCKSLSSETTQDQSDPIQQRPPESPTPDSLDSRIQMLLSAGSPVLPVLSQECSDSETSTEDHETDSICQPQPSPKASSSSDPDPADVVPNCDQMAPREGFSESGIDDVSPSPLNMTDEEYEHQSTQRPPGITVSQCHQMKILFLNNYSPSVFTSIKMSVLGHPK